MEFIRWLLAFVGFVIWLACILTHQFPNAWAAILGAVIVCLLYYAAFDYSVKHAPVVEDWDG